MIQHSLQIPTALKIAKRHFQTFEAQLPTQEHQKSTSTHSTLPYLTKLITFIKALIPFLEVFCRRCWSHLHPKCQVQPLQPRQLFLPNSSTPHPVSFHAS